MRIEFGDDYLRDLTYLFDMSSGRNDPFFETKKLKVIGIDIPPYKII